MGRVPVIHQKTPHKGSRASQKCKAVLKKINPFNKSKKYDALRAFKNVRPASVKKLKKRKSYGISATSTPMAAPGKRVAKTGNGTPNDQSLDFIPLEASPSPAIRRSGRKKNGRYFNEKLPPPSPASLVARAKQFAPVVIDISQTEDDNSNANGATKSKKEKMCAKKGKKEARVVAGGNASREPGEITISDSDDESPVVADEIMIVAEKNLRRFPPVLDRITPAKSKQGFADYVNTKGKNNIANHRKDRRHQPYPMMGTKATSASRLRGAGGRIGGAERETRSASDLQKIANASALNRSPPATQQPPGQPPSNIIDAPDGRQAAFPSGLRPIVIDGSNVAVQHSIAIGHGNHRFSSKGIKICVDFFKKRGHEVTVFVPQHRTKSGMADDRHLLDQLYQAGILSFTPPGTYDDRFVLQYAENCGGIVVSNDQYNDIKNESPALFETATRRKLGFTWAKNTLMFPTDPLGRNGPSLNRFLQF